MQTCECTHAQQTTVRAVQLTGERAVMIINLEEPVSNEVIAELDAVPDLFGARLIDLR